MEEVEEIRFVDEKILIARLCRECGSRQLKLVKILKTEIGQTLVSSKTKNFIGVCTNPTCWRYSNPKDIPSWVREEEFLENRVVTPRSYRG